MVMNVAFLMGICHVRRQHFQTDRFSYDPGGQITLCVEHIAIFIGIFIDDRLIFIHQFVDRKVDVCCFAALEITMGPIVDIFFS